MSGLDSLGAEEVKPRRFSLSRSVFAVAAGALGAVFIPKHPVLAFLGFGALASNAHAVATGDKTTKNALRRIGCHIVATAGSLALPKYPAVGYVAGAVAGELFIDGQGGGLIEEWTHKNDIEVKPVATSKALVKA